MHALVLGGIRSGKTALAESLALQAPGPVVYVATATADDAEMAERIARHRANRPPEWELEEEPLALASVMARHAGRAPCLLIDCMSLWLSNLLAAGEETLEQQMDSFLEAVENWPGTLVVVSNEVGLGVVGMDALTREFCDRLGWLNQDLAARCDRVLLSIAGQPLALKGPLVKWT